ncbi:MAG TPA: hypothetical protein VLT32_05315, partial [Candidatus Sulfomarinibacteraceae bacterium]|nr:hypothetical protein [Candidatus Sulfomarinibacteraceae bacterium]
EDPRSRGGPRLRGRDVEVDDRRPHDQDVVGDLDGPLWGGLMQRLMEGNRVFDPTVRMLLTVGDLEDDTAPGS